MSAAASRRPGQRGLRPALARRLLPLACLLASALPGPARAESPPPHLPAAAAVARMLQEAPAARAAAQRGDAGAAEGERIAAGPHEWAVRAGSLRRRVQPADAANTVYGEYEAGIERALRLPGKSRHDAELGAAHGAVARAEAALIHTALRRALLDDWFAGLREEARVGQWRIQVDLLERQAVLVRRRLALGDAARLEAELAEAALAQARAELLQAEGRAAIARTRLRQRYPGLPELSPGPLPLPEAEAPDEALAALRQHAVERDPLRTLAAAERRRADAVAALADAERTPDPTVALLAGRERHGEERTLGISVSIPLPGAARAAGARAGRMQAGAARDAEAAAAQAAAVEADALLLAARRAPGAWRAAHAAAERLDGAAVMSARAHALGEAPLSDLLAARRLANEAALAARLAQIDALEADARLRLAAGQLWAEPAAPVAGSMADPR